MKKTQNEAENEACIGFRIRCMLSSLGSSGENQAPAGENDLRNGLKTRAALDLQSNVRGIGDARNLHGPSSRAALVRAVVRVVRAVRAVATVRDDTQSPNRDKSAENRRETRLSNSDGAGAPWFLQVRAGELTRGCYRILYEVRPLLSVPVAGSLLTVSGGGPRV